MKKGSLLIAIVCLSLNAYAADTQVLNVSDGVVQIEGNLEVNGNIDAEGLISDIMGLVIPTGTIMPYAGASAPDGWKICDGSELNRIEDKKLYDVIGTLYGSGNDVDTFNIPDLQGVFLRGAGQNTTMKKANDEFYDGGTVGQRNNDMFQDHKHEIDHDHPSKRTTTNGEHAHNISSVMNFAGGGTEGNGGNGKGTPISRTAAAGNHYHYVDLPLIEADSSEASIPTEDDGIPRNGDETAPASVSVNYIIKL